MFLDCDIIIRLLLILLGWRDGSEHNIPISQEIYNNSFVQADLGNPTFGCRPPVQVLQILSAKINGRKCGTASCVLVRTDR